MSERLAGNAGFSILWISRVVFHSGSRAPAGQQREIGLSQRELNQNEFEMLAIKVYLFLDLCYLNSYK